MRARGNISNIETAPARRLPARVLSPFGLMSVFVRRWLRYVFSVDHKRIWVSVCARKQMCVFHRVLY